MLGRRSLSLATRIVLLACLVASLCLPLGARAEPEAPPVVGSELLAASGAPYTPSNPSPADGQMDVGAPVKLSWTGGDPDSGDTVKYTVYSNGGPVPGCTNLTTTSCTPAALEATLWYVVATDSAGNTAKGPTWSFALRGDCPVGQYKAEYFNNKDLAGTPVVKRCEALSFDWGNASPAPGVNADEFSVRWTGALWGNFGEMYRLSATVDDGVRLWVNDELLVDQWHDQPPTTYSTGYRIPWPKC